MFFIAINQYRSSTSCGFANTWNVYATESRQLRDSVLRDGLPVRDIRNGDGSAVWSDMGIRAVTNAERYLWHKEDAEDVDHGAMMLEDYLGEYHVIRHGTHTVEVVA